MYSIYLLLILILVALSISHGFIVNYSNLQSKIKIYCVQSDEEAAEQRKINAILKEQGLTVNDLRELKDAITTGKRYNKRIPGAMPTPTSAAITQPKLTSLASESAYSEPSSATSVKSEKVVPKTSSIAEPRKKLSFVLKSSKSTTPIVINSAASTTPTPPPTLRTQSIQPPPSPVAHQSPHRGESQGVTLKIILESLVEEYGFEYLHKSTGLRCFSLRPTVTSALKVLRQADMIWAREKVEALYYEVYNKEKRS